MTRTTATAEDVLLEYVAAVERGDREAVASLFAEDASWTLAAGDLPISGTWEGRHAILDGFLATAMAVYEPGSVSIEVTALLADGDRAVLQWTSRARLRDGTDYENGCIGLFTIRDGRIGDVREYMDTLYVHDRTRGLGAP